MPVDQFEAFILKASPTLSERNRIGRQAGPVAEPLFLALSELSVNTAKENYY